MKLRYHAMQVVACLALIVAGVAVGRAENADASDAFEQDPEALVLPPGEGAGLVEPYAVLDFSSRSANRQFLRRGGSKSADFLWNTPARFSLAGIESEPAFVPYLKTGIADLEKQAEVFPGDANVLTVLGVRLYQTNQVDRSVEALARALEADPEHERCSELYSGIVVIGGQVDRAVEDLPRILSIMPHNRVIRFNTACAFARQTNAAEVVYHLGVLKDLGWRELRRYLGDPDLDPVRRDARFIQLSSQVDEQARLRVIENLSKASRKPL